MAADDPLPQLLAIEGLTDKLSITTHHVHRLVAERRIPFLEVGRLVRFDPAEVASWLEQRRQPPQGARGQS